MSFQWTFLASFLYCEIAFVVLLLLPFLSPTTWRRLFKSRLIVAFKAGAKYYFNFIICIFGLLFLDSIRELKKYSDIDLKDMATPHGEAHAHMKQFRSQRNFYIAGFALFLWFVIKRLIHLLSDIARQMADSAAMRKQAEGANRQFEELTKTDSKKSDNQGASSEEYAAEIAKYKKEINQLREEKELLREQYTTSVKDFDKLSAEHQKLQNKMAVLAGNESAKDK